MSGHSKWSTIKRKKEKIDGARAKIFTKIGREIAIAVREGGSADPAANAKLRDCIAKAKANNVPNENIERIIKKASGENDGKTYESLTYEGYGPCGIAVIVEALTDNRNRTAADLRHYFDKFGGNLGTTGCVSFMFNEKGVIVIDNEEGDIDEDQMMEDALESGCSDFVAEGDAFEVYTDPADFGSVVAALEEKGYTFVSADVEQVPDTYSCIINTAVQVTSSPMCIAVTVNKQNLTHDMIAATNKFNLSILDVTAPFSLFERFGFQSGRSADKFKGFDGAVKTGNGLMRLTEHACAFICGWVISTVDRSCGRPSCPIS